MSVTRTRQDLATIKDFMKNIENSLRYALKTSDITDFRLHPVKKGSCDNSLEPSEPCLPTALVTQSLFQKSAKKILVLSAKNHLRICQFF